LEVVGLLFFIGLFIGLGGIGLSLLLVVLAIFAIIMHLGIVRSQIACILVAVSLYLMYTAIAM
jgi:hypothetical protein